MATQPAVQPVGLARPMKIESKHKNVIVEMSEDGKTGNVVSAPGKGTRVLPLHYSLTGEVEPTLAPLSIDYSLDSNTSYRYDWVVGSRSKLGLS